MNIFKVNGDTPLESIRGIRAMYPNAEFDITIDIYKVDTMVDCYISKIRNCDECLHSDQCNVVACVKGLL